MILGTRIVDIIPVDLLEQPSHHEFKQNEEEKGQEELFVFQNPNFLFDLEGSSLGFITRVLKFIV